MTGCCHRSLRNSTCLGWLKREAEEGRLLAQGALFALAGEGGIAEFGGIEGGARLDHGVQAARQLVGGGDDGTGRPEFGAHATEPVAPRSIAYAGPKQGGCTHEKTADRQDVSPEGMAVPDRIIRNR